VTKSGPRAPFAHGPGEQLLAVRLRDAATNRWVAVPFGGGPCHIRLAPPAGDRGSTVRVALVGDLLRRVVELGGGQAFVTSVRELPELLAYNIHPVATAARDEAADVVVGAVEPGRPSVLVAPVLGVPWPDAEPLVARLCLLEVAHETPARVSDADVANARCRLTRWRAMVAEWAEHPSAAMSSGYAGRLGEHAGSGLDLAACLQLLDRAATGTDVPAGAKFELFVYADRLLGLDLVADLRS
jgi:hypothetical protein